MVSYYSIMQICLCWCSQHSGGNIHLCSPRVIPSLPRSHTLISHLIDSLLRFLHSPAPSPFCAKSLFSQLTEEMAAYKQQGSKEEPVAQHPLGHTSVHLTFLPLTVAWMVSVMWVTKPPSHGFFIGTSSHMYVMTFFAHIHPPSPLLVHTSPLIAYQVPPKRLPCTDCHAACMALQVKSLATKGHQAGDLSLVPMTHIVLVENRLLQFVPWLPYLPHGTYMYPSPK